MKQHATAAANAAAFRGLRACRSPRERIPTLAPNYVEYTSISGHDAHVLVNGVLGITSLT